MANIVFKFSRPSTSSFALLKKKFVPSVSPKIENEVPIETIKFAWEYVP